MDIEAAIAKLKTVGIYAGKRIPLNRDPAFSIALSGGRKKLFFQVKDDAKYTLSIVGVSKRHRQAVIRVKEPYREIIETFTRYRDYGKKEKLANPRLAMKTVIPPTARLSAKYVKDPELKEAEDTGKRYKEYIHTYAITAKVPETDIYFLVGYDEHKMFISMLPRAVDSVADAHDSLMPEEIVGVSGVVRQGEFFFVPITEKEKISLMAASHSEHFSDATYGRVAIATKRVDVYSDHRASVQVLFERKSFVTGYVGNDRHKLFLNGWYRVVRNKELNPDVSGINGRSFD